VSPDEGGLRVGVQGGGLLRLVYAMAPGHPGTRPDKIFEEFGARIFCRSEKPFVPERHDTRFEETLMRRGLFFVNPHAARSCGCGKFVQQPRWHGRSVARQSFEIRLAAKARQPFLFLGAILAWRA